MASPDHDGATVRIPPPLLYLAIAIAGGVIHVFLYPLPIDLSLAVRGAAGAVAFLLGLAVMAPAVGLFRRTGQDPKPWIETPEIISTGIYRFTRNPMYVSMALLQVAIGVWFGSWWIIALVPVSLVSVYLIAVRHEEAYLEGKFGDGYLDYKRSVRRWI
jgi:protein-S-isoprenylcysteine O-methyltransferase Ste14